MESQFQTSALQITQTPILQSITIIHNHHRARALLHGPALPSIPNHPLPPSHGFIHQYGAVKIQARGRASFPLPASPEIKLPSITTINPSKHGQSAKKERRKSGNEEKREQKSAEQRRTMKPSPAMNFQVRTHCLCSLRSHPAGKALPCPAMICPLHLRFLIQPLLALHAAAIITATQCRCPAQFLDGAAAFQQPPHDLLLASLPPSTRASVPPTITDADCRSCPALLLTNPPPPCISAPPHFPQATNLSCRRQPKLAAAKETEKK
jgi:hypothetical protein